MLLMWIVLVIYDIFWAVVYAIQRDGLLAGWSMTNAFLGAYFATRSWRRITGDDERES